MGSPAYFPPALCTTDPRGTWCASMYALIFSASRCAASAMPRALNVTFFAAAGTRALSAALALGLRRACDSCARRSRTAAEVAASAALRAPPRAGAGVAGALASGLLPFSGAEGPASGLPADLSQQHPYRTFQTAARQQHMSGSLPGICQVPKLLDANVSVQAGRPRNRAMLHSWQCMHAREADNKRASSVQVRQQTDTRKHFFLVTGCSGEHGVAQPDCADLLMWPGLAHRRRDCHASPEPMRASMKGSTTE